MLFLPHHRTIRWLERPFAFTQSQWATDSISSFAEWVWDAPEVPSVSDSSVFSPRSKKSSFLTTIIHHHVSLKHWSYIVRTRRVVILLSRTSSDTGQTFERLHILLPPAFLRWDFPNILERNLITLVPNSYTTELNTYEEFEVCLCAKTSKVKTRK